MYKGKPAAFPVRKYAVRNADNLFSHSLLLALFLSSRYLRSFLHPLRASVNTERARSEGKTVEMLVCVCSEDISAMFFGPKGLSPGAGVFLSP